MKPLPEVTKNLSAFNELSELKKRGRPKKALNANLTLNGSSSSRKRGIGFSDWQVRSHVLSSLGKLDSAKQCGFQGCTHRFRNTKDMTVHFLREHLGQEVHNCRFCPKSFLNPKALEMHLRLYHESELIQEDMERRTLLTPQKTQVF